ncbi:hypothetical protein C8F01DRAFT_1246256 [Mycena amicta]|nr:hypothetical protein C8F01DRAFT_1246256 [Mycena amicta]
MFKAKAAVFAAVALVLSVAPMPAQGNFQAWTNTDCPGTYDINVACDGTCLSFGGQSAYTVTESSPGHCVELFTDDTCSTIRQTLNGVHGGFCYNAPGAPVATHFKCLSKSNCF